VSRAPKKKPNTVDTDLQKLWAVSLEIATDKQKSARDRNAAVANGIKIKAIEHKISPAEPESFFS
jgi:hypothetical protein